MLNSWNDGPTKSAIVDFVERVVNDVAPEDRIAVFDNDGTLWCERPSYIQLDFLVRRMAEQAAADPSLARHQPYTAAASSDLSWFGDAITKQGLPGPRGRRVGPRLITTGGRAETVVCLALAAVIAAYPFRGHLAALIEGAIA